MKKTILIVCALKLEMDAIKSGLLDFQDPGISLKYLISGTGNYNTLFSLQEYLRTHDIDMVLNIGVCGVTPKMKDIPKYFQVYRILNLASSRESLVPIYVKLFSLQSIASSEKVITAPDDMQGEQFVDMESFAVDYIATKLKIPHIIIKAPFDTVGDKSKNVDIQSISLILQKIPLLEVIELLKNYIGKQKSTYENIEKYIQHFGFTFAQTEIFKKQKNRFQALGIDFQIFFKTHKHLSKKDFLTLMQDAQ